MRSAVATSPATTVAACPRTVQSVPGVLHAAGNYFATPDGRAIYLAGNHTWVDGQEIGATPFDFAGYLDLLQRENANLIRVWAWQSAVDGGGSYGHVAALPYVQTTDGKFDLRRLNQAYFDKLRSEVQAAGAKGLYVSIMLFNGWSVRSDGSANDPWLTNPFNAANNLNGINGDPGKTGMGLDTQTLRIPSVWAVERRYIAKIVQTTSDLPNVLFEVSNESTGSDADFAWQNAVVGHIKRLEQSNGGLQHPVGMSAFDWFNASGLWSSQDYVNAQLFRSHADWIAPAAGSQVPDQQPRGLRSQGHHRRHGPYLWHRRRRPLGVAAVYSRQQRPRHG